MEKFEKRTKYLDYVEYGDKIRNGGVLRTETESGKCRVQITVKGLYPTDTTSVEIWIEDGEKQYKADVMMLHHGEGTYNAIWNMDNLAGSGLTYDEWGGIVLTISEHRLLRSRWILLKEQGVECATQLEQEQTEEGPIIVEEEIEEYSQIETETIIEELPSERTVDQTSKHEIEMPGNRFAELYEDKWTQLGQYYRTVRPFGDKRTYLSLTPSDFIVLGRQYQKLVSNSFLLHGYYNYGHLILARIEEEGEYNYYIGVPGIFHEREIQAAKLFGFKGFEGASGPYVEGGFGYYMQRVEI